MDLISNEVAMSSIRLSIVYRDQSSILVSASHYFLAVLALADLSFRLSCVLFNLCSTPFHNLLLPKNYRSRGIGSAMGAVGEKT